MDTPEDDFERKYDDYNAMAYEYIVHESEKAIGFQFSHVTDVVWVPKSCIGSIDRDSQAVEIASWFCRKEGIEE